MLKQLPQKSAVWQSYAWTRASWRDTVLTCTFLLILALSAYHLGEGRAEKANTLHRRINVSAPPQEKRTPLDGTFCTCPACPACTTPATAARPQSNRIALTKWVHSISHIVGGQNITLVAPLDDIYVAQAWLNGQGFEPEKLEFMLQQIKPGSTVVDAGTNWGSYIAFFGAKAGSAGRVFGFEPQLKMFQAS